MRKWYSLIDKVYQKDNLILASKQVRRNHGAPGIDGETVEAYMDKLDTQTLKDETYESVEDMESNA